MKLLHLADLHLGKAVNEFSMIEDQRDMLLEKIVPLVRAQGIGAVLIAGDVYDKRQPSEAAVKLLDDFLSALAETEAAVFLISGNHDSDERLNFGSRLFRSRNIHIVGKYEGSVPEVVLEDEWGPVHFWLLPFVKASVVSHYHPEEEIADYETAVQVALRMATVDASERNVILAHQFVAGSGDPELAGSEMAVASVGNVERVSSRVFDAFDYAALGHIHRPQSVGRDTVRYAGSPLKYSLREINDTKSAPLVTLGKKGEIAVDFVPLTPLHEMRQIRGTLDKLLRAGADGCREDYIYAILTDETPIPDAMALLREVYPNAMKLDYDNSHTKNLASLPELSDLEARGFEDIFRDFYQAQIGGEPGPEEWDIMRRLAREAGVME